VLVTVVVVARRCCCCSLLLLILLLKLALSLVLVLRPAPHLSLLVSSFTSFLLCGSRLMKSVIK
jgi:hypothetical protein